MMRYTYKKDLGDGYEITDTESIPLPGELVAYCYTKEHAEIITSALNVVWLLDKLKEK